MEKSDEETLRENTLEIIKKYVDKYTDNYIISLHYLSVPIIISYGKRIPENEKFRTINEYIETQKEVIKILMMEKAEYIKGFYFIKRTIESRKTILESADQDTFESRAARSGLETYTINELRMTWKTNRYKYLTKALITKTEKLYLPNEDHPLYKSFTDFLKNTYKRGVDRFKTFICVGSTYIGKSVFFTKFIVPDEYYIYHSNNLEYSKMSNQPHKIFRILDDINWSEVKSTELKALMNRNISSVDIKYGYEYIFPLIPIIIVNKEDYINFQRHFSDIWKFIERNAVIYPEQKEECIEEERPIFTQKEVRGEYKYLFDSIIPVNELKECDTVNMNEWIKKELNEKHGYIYDIQKYIQLPSEKEIKLPNPERQKRKILEDYEEYLMRKKKAIIESEIQRVSNRRRREDKEQSDEEKDRKCEDERYEDEKLIESETDYSTTNSEDEYSGEDKEETDTEEVDDGFIEL
ncbi:hypothetical protein CL6EHI_174580 [Entamoeba histolytica]|uniref:Uncharacterized protein n=6 Tax=Entamoeba histolytica TaxID=5759 RepID=C4LZK6_ENTH1|nr:hypothetical protein EHI_174580 [Entamoeba histolytica HM-1:IMSS]EAL47933.2 hypothetical protein EHI_174580 [Entamoeba histolytica HM-1:IMSS]EMD42915.1 Hypothetical protein EHI5A_188400 [Entamoeba histolytica KU27]ENY63727.1 hypothetical protein EHI7A_138770 [Entamoeba histolytica HM-1:IMSS-A]GAT94304.1 hypothetical protein CL6EHI_174580 [Entamoeba histolytica]|eukprot:XP_653319.2 hypothetical protein EHI_174580 [Entamoeba histolytica HM-1:IMSS]